MTSPLDRIYALLEALKPGDALPNEVVQEILSWDMTDVPHYTAEELAEPASKREAGSVAPVKRIRDAQH